MSKELMVNTPANLEGLPSEIKEKIISDGKSYSTPNVKLKPTIGIDMSDENIGTFNISSDLSGKKTTELLGKELDIVILKERRTFSFYNDKTQELELFSNEIDITAGIIRHESPVVIRSKDGIEFQGTYKEFLEAKKVRWIEDDTGEYVKSKLKQKTLFYVYLPQHKMIARLFVTFASLFGLENKKYRFKNPEEGSLEALRKAHTGIAPYTYITSLTNIRGEGSINWRQLKFTFKEMVPTDQVVDMFNLKQATDDYCNSLDISFGINDQSQGVRQEPPQLSPEELPIINIDDEPTWTPPEDLRIEDIPF